MSKLSPLLNGESTGSVSEYTDASVNMVAAIHDHISCAKPLTNQYHSQDSKSGILTYTCDFDHMYASLADSTSKDTSEIKCLKDFLLLHLDLVQHQSEQLVFKDKEITALKKENEMLRQRLERMDRRVTLQKHRDIPGELGAPVASDNVSTTSLSVTSPLPIALPVEIVEADSLVIPLNSDSSDLNIQGEPLTIDTTEIIKTETQCVTPPHSWDSSKKIKREADCGSGGSGNGRRKRLGSWTSSVNSDTTSQDGHISLLPQNHRKVQKRVSAKGCLKKDATLETNSHYYTLVGDIQHAWGIEKPELNGHVNETCTVQVPSWRNKVYTSCYSMEGTENLDDDVFNRRHQRLEIDERRRKRWDVQRIREQRQIEKLRQRETSVRRRRRNNANSHTNMPIETFWPHPDDAEYVEVSDDLPVAAFGYCITKLPASDFSLPWLSTKSKVCIPAMVRRKMESKR